VRKLNGEKKQLPSQYFCKEKKKMLKNMTTVFVWAVIYLQVFHFFPRAE
jgi:hypothetical protein